VQPLDHFAQGQIRPEADNAIDEVIPVKANRLITIPGGKERAREQPR